MCRFIRKTVSFIKPHIWSSNLYVSLENYSHKKNYYRNQKQNLINSNIFYLYYIVQWAQKWKDLKKDMMEWKGNERIRVDPFSLYRCGSVFYLYKCIMMCSSSSFLYDACDLVADYRAHKSLSLSLLLALCVCVCVYLVISCGAHSVVWCITWCNSGATYAARYNDFGLIWFNYMHSTLSMCSSLFCCNFQSSFWFSPSFYRRCVDVVDFSLRPFSI